jgi:hypothetical protein
LLFASCSPETALDLVLDPSADVTDTELLLQRLAHIQLTLDSGAGLYPAGTKIIGAETIVDNFDGDSASELRITLPVEGMDHLPLLRLEQGNLPAAGLTVTIVGLDANAERVVAGGKEYTPLSFAEGELAEVQLAFNLNTEYRRPQASQTFPEGGSIKGPNQVGQIEVQFSLPMDAVSVRKEGVFQLLRLAAEGQELLVPATEIVVYPPPAGKLITVATYRLAQTLDAGHYRIRVTTGANAEGPDGLELDQYPNIPGSQAFVAEFEVGSAAASAPTTWPQCVDCDKPCGLGGKVCPEGYRCNATRQACEAVACPSPCEQNKVCDPTVNFCVEDCRVFGAAATCPRAAPYCGASGLCQPTP